MPLINLLPNEIKNSNQPHKKEAKTASTSKLPVEIPFKLPLVIIIPLFLIILGGLFIQVKTNEKKLAELTQKSGELKTKENKLNELAAKKQELNDSIAFLKENSQAKTIWTQKLSLIQKLLPTQVWLTSIDLESQTIKTADLKIAPTKKAPIKKTPPVKGSAELKIAPTKKAPINLILTIKGSATSLIETEIISSITQFADTLKKDAGFSKEFTDIKLGSLQSDKRGNLTVMSFVIYCKS